MCQESIKHKMMTSHFKSSCTIGFYQSEQHNFICRGEEHLTLPPKVGWLLFWLIARGRKAYLLHILFRHSTNKIHESDVNVALLLLLLLSRFSRVRLCATPSTAAHQAPPSLGFSGKNTGVGCHFLLQCMKVKSESEVAQLCLTLRDPMNSSPRALLHLWNFPGKSTGVGCHCLLRSYHF